MEATGSVARPLRRAADGGVKVGGEAGASEEQALVGAAAPAASV